MTILLDERFLLTIRRWPEIVAALFERVTAQEQRRDIHRALLQLPRVEDRVHALLWLLAERWGQVTAHGVILRLRLTHELIGQLVGAKRPTVSLALKELEARGGFQRLPDGGWLLAQPWVPEQREAQPSTPVEAWAAPTGLDSGEPRWRRYTASTAIDATARNSDCQFCSVRFQKSARER